MMTKMLVIDPEKCTGCRLCEVVCSVRKEGVSNPSRSRISIVKWEMEGINFPMVCWQCQLAPCITVCPTNAISRDKILDRVVVDYDLCIGCRMCVVACPFGCMRITPLISKVIKCDLCDGAPACVEVCSTKALQYLTPVSASAKKKREAVAELAQLIKKFV